MKRGITVHQTVHGYDRGHRLMAASMKLDKVDLGVLHSLSDAAGYDLDERFDGYLTGYPLPSRSLFVVARTWRAPEMPRPGCVWTHSLLVRTADLAVWEDLERLVALLARPTDPTSPSFRVPLELEQVTSTRRPRVDPSILREAIFGVYGMPKRPVWIETDQDVVAELLVLWSQQWPALRRTFSFCTRAASPRWLGKRPFDLQFTTHDRASAFRREFNGPSEGPGRPRDVHMLAVVLEQALRPSELYTRFLRAVGPKLSGRKSMVPITELYQALVAGEPLGAWHAVAALGESGLLASSVAAEALGAGRNRSFPQELLAPEAELISLLLRRGPPPGIDAGALGLSERVANFWTANRGVKGILEDVLKQLHPRAMTAAAAGIASAATPADLDRLWSASNELAQGVISERPQLLGSPVSWTKSYPTVEQLRHLDLADAELTTIVKELVDKEEGRPADRLHEAYGDRMASPTVQAARVAPIPGPWRRLLKRSGSLAVGELLRSPSPSLAALIQDLVSTQDVSRASEVPEDVWLSGLRFQDPFGDRVRRATFCFDLSEQEATQMSGRLAVAAFEILYADVRQRTSRERRSLGLLFFGTSKGDQRARLRERLARMFARHQWPAEALCEINVDYQSFKSLARQLRKHSDGRTILRGLAESSTCSESRAKAAREALRS